MEPLKGKALARHEAGRNLGRELLTAVRQMKAGKAARWHDDAEGLIESKRRGAQRVHGLITSTPLSEESGRLRKTSGIKLGSSRRKYVVAAQKRLRGRWQSDAKKTMSRWVFPKRLAGTRLRTWKGVFGHNEWRITAARIYANFKGHKSVAAYQIIWADDWSAVLVLRSKIGERTYHVHFDEPWLYFLAGKDICEYFRRTSLRSRRRL
jgi:hypothetical protein